MFCHLGHFFFLSLRVCYFKGRSLRCSPGRGNAGRCAVTLYVGAGPSGSNGAHLTLLWISIFHSNAHNQTGPLWCWFPSKWACAHSRPPSGPFDKTNITTSYLCLTPSIFLKVACVQFFKNSRLFQPYIHFHR